MAEADPGKMVNVHEAKTHFSKLLERAHAGEEIILAKAGRPYAKLVPIDAPLRARRIPGGLTVTGEIPDSLWFDPMPEDELALWEGKGLEKFGL
ncbi:MAG: type II toxin-antitoxin system Phd/YefM family antitoxin [Sphingomonas sp.]|jgi:prevent-host-death family protein|uniref:type II toxin-antitoxin system Phd/YefM family antitoxin n=1 Tax=Sphingomonas sp. TaxID=28214 RepID=UPI00356419EC